MKLSSFFALGVCSMVASAQTPGPKYTRLIREDAAVLIVDHQAGLFTLVHDFDTTQFYHQVMLHAAIGTAFDLPIIMTTSTESGPTGPMLREIVELNPNATFIRRDGEINAWDNEEFRRAVEATGKKQFIIGGIVTEGCTAYLALSMREAGYEVFANVEASGTTSELIRNISNDRMAASGVQLMSAFAIIGELTRDWRNTPGAREIFPFLSQYMPPFNVLIQAHQGAVENGTVVPTGA
ncbi:Isochorismatase-like protein [Stachybotrys elegans]|uniref:Isochorismatase-like protein n=1 Tax=Stachybotrys elegans TaxID=80388 RepID=A0A8K0SX44_9HYPO|nr:Isochorismatase-like protein [Stachybotrys elegans]